MHLQLRRVTCNIDDIRDLDVTGEVLAEIFESLGLEEVLSG